jgi:3-oxoacyl-[acyl-carrier-protein] synthase II
MSRAGVGPEELWAVARSGAGGRLGVEEERAVAQACGAHHAAVPSPLGDLSGAAAIFQVVSALTLAGRDPAASGRVVAVTSVDRDGQTGCALLRLRHPDPS